MTEEERQMMNTIHCYGLILSLDGGTKNTTIDRIEAILEENAAGSVMR